jgi:Zn-dependent protease with chaperone function
MFYALACALGLTAFLLANAATSLAVAAFAGPLLSAARAMSPRRAARALFLLRALPSLAATLFAAGVFLPSFLILEPRRTTEPVGPGLLLLAGAGLLPLVAGAVRGIVACRATGRLARRWLQGAERVPLAAALPVFRIREARPLVALVGTRRARVFVASRVLEALSADELEAVVVHEQSHLAARDNLKRLLLRACPDLLVFGPLARRLEREWVHASEIAADAAAVRPGSAQALDLAAALVKVARLLPGAEEPTLLTSALHGGDEVASRVRRLVDPMHAAASSRALWPLGLAGLLAFAAVIACAPGLLATVHAATEAAVDWLR